MLFFHCGIRDVDLSFPLLFSRRLCVSAFDQTLLGTWSNYCGRRLAGELARRGLQGADNGEQACPLNRSIARDQREILR